MHNERMEILPLRQISWLHVNNQQLKLFFKKPRTKIVAGLLLWNKGHSPNKIETWRAAFKETYAKISQLSWILVPTNISGGSHAKLARHKKTIYQTHPRQALDNMDRASLKSMTPKWRAQKSSWLHRTGRF